MIKSMDKNKVYTFKNTSNQPLPEVFPSVSMDIKLGKKLSKDESIDVDYNKLTDELKSVNASDDQISALTIHISCLEDDDSSLGYTYCNEDYINITALHEEDPAILFCHSMEGVLHHELNHITEHHRIIGKESLELLRKITNSNLEINNLKFQTEAIQHPISSVKTLNNLIKYNSTNKGQYYDRPSEVSARVAELKYEINRCNKMLSGKDPYELKVFRINSDNDEFFYDDYDEDALNVAITDELFKLYSESLKNKSRETLLDKLSELDYEELPDTIFEGDDVARILNEITEWALEKLYSSIQSHPHQNTSSNEL